MTVKSSVDMWLPWRTSRPTTKGRIRVLVNGVGDTGEEFTPGLKELDASFVSRTDLACVTPFLQANLIDQLGTRKTFCNFGAQ